MSVAIVTDSTADLDPNRAAEAGVDVVPLFVNFGAQSFRDRVDITREEFYRRLAAEPVLPTTSQAPAAVYEEIFERRIAAGDDVVCLSISSRLSGTINAALAAATRFPSGRIAIFDSRTVSGGLLLLVLRAVELARSGSGAEAIVAELERIRARQSLYAALPDLSHAVRTGRISKTLAMVGGIMKISPVITLDREGQVAEYARVRTFSRALDTLVEATRKQIEGARDARVAIVHARAETAAASLRERLEPHVANAGSLEVLETGPAIATHAGIGAVGVFSLTV